MRVQKIRSGIRRLFAVVCLLGGVCRGITAYAQEEADIAAALHATAAVLMDADSGRVLYGKNADEPMAMASTTKIMTCILVLENVSPDEVLTVSSYAASMPKVHLGVRRGEQYTVRDMLYSLMLESHNDAAVALAEYVGKRFLPEELMEKPTEEYGTEESRQAVAAFAALMNEKAAALGCENTWFITPNGLDAKQEFAGQDGEVLVKEHSTTARELARIMSYCIRESEARDAFLEITGAGSYAFCANGRSFSCTNHNAFLNMMDGAISGKTGFTNKAGYCYVGALEQGGRTFVVTLLACGWPNHKTWKWSDTRILMQYGTDSYFYRSFDEPGIAFEESRLLPVTVLNGQTNILGQTAYTAIRIAGREDGKDAGVGALAVGNAAEWKKGLLMKEGEKITVDYAVADVLEAPVEAGREVGYIEYKVDGVVYKRETIVTETGVDRIDAAWCVRQVVARFLPDV